MRKFLSTNAGRALLLSVAIVLLSGALCVLMHAEYILALGAPAGLIIGAAAIGMSMDEQPGIAIKLVVVCPIALFMFMVGATVGAVEQHLSWGWGFAALGLLSAAAALVPRERELSPAKLPEHQTS